MDQKVAASAFRNFLLHKQTEIGEPLAPVSSAQRLSSGWSFFYQSQAYIASGDFGEMLVGQGPVIICDDGRIIEGGSLNHDPEALLAR
ncbi:YrhB domain-containing protein [Novosphingobium beihaiensis]|uniref:YrhB family protein n=1 Tax=Novosphingobium beihaiensis TaxID=2930389 RepID=A0ABT0BU08_9SPHN|nr:YrhB domain-containing protein [Novosphingobium beihaiensis]MCJ2188529.1 YrhB family protein [Novosphingobium beihaiensis]